jgi:hypothetical protein
MFRGGMGYPRVFQLAAVDVFGTRVSEQDVLAQVRIAPGEPADEDLAGRCKDATARLQSDGRWAFANVSQTDYFAGPEAGRSYITVDLVDKGEEHRLKFDPDPTDHVDDPAGLVATWREYEQRAHTLLREDKLDLSEGQNCRALHYTLGFGNPTLVHYDEHFARQVPLSFEALVQILRRDSDLHQRAAAAFLLAYGCDAQVVADAELASIRDPSFLVRNNTLRVLCLLPERARQPVRIAVEPLLDALSFPMTSDRNKAANALFSVLVRDSSAQALVRSRVQPVLKRMAALEQPNNRVPALEILRVLGC